MFPLKYTLLGGQKPTSLLDKHVFFRLPGTISAFRSSTGITGVLLGSISHSMGLTPNWITGLFLVGPRASKRDQFVLISSGLKKARLNLDNLCLG